MIKCSGPFLLFATLCLAGTALAEDAGNDATYAYSPVGKRDPFRSPRDDFDRLRRAGSELERWDLDQLKLIAVVFGSGLPYAMLEDPNGKGHIVRFGTHVGPNSGRVVGIRERTVVVRETYHDWKGTRISEDVAFEIPKPVIEI